MSKQTDLLIYSPILTNRLKYILDLIFEHHLSITYQLVTAVNLYSNDSANKLNYSDTRISQNEIRINPSNILSGTNADSIEVPAVVSRGAFPFFFEQSEGDFEFDIFGLVFYLVTRYEEYHSNSLDKHGRYPSKNSLAVQHQFIQIPLVDLWIQKLGELLKNKFPKIALKKRTYHFQPSMDVDMAWSFRNKGVARNMGGLLKDIIKLDIPQASKRTGVLVGNNKDPFDQFDFMNQLHGNKNQSLIHFFLVANRGKFDKNISVDNIEFQQLIQKIAHQNPIGLHPSYQSNEDHAVLKNEQQQLEKIVNKKIEKSRQHFIKLQLPHTYRQLIKLGIREDYSMGYPDIIGFRASTAIPFKWFDLEANEVTDLTIFPFQVMDVTLKNYLKLNPEEAVQQSKAIIDQCRKVNGTFMTIWHNSSFDEQEGWKDWDKVYTQIVDYAS